jgi:hypothetical protein
MPAVHAGVSVRQAHHGELIHLSFDVLLGPDPSGGTLEVSAVDGPAAWAASSAVHSQGCSRATTLQVSISPPPLLRSLLLHEGAVILLLAACRWR